MWDIETCSQLFLLEIPEGPGTSVSFSPDGHVIALGSLDGTMQFWNGATGKDIGRMCRQGLRIFAVEFSVDGKHVYAVDNAGPLMMWELNGGQPPLIMDASGVQTPEGMQVVRTTFVDDTVGMPPRRVLENDDEGAASMNGTFTSHPVFFDGMGEPAIGDWSYIDEDGWMRNRHVNTSDTEMDENDPILFWVPPANRPKFWWPRNISVPDSDFTACRANRFLLHEADCALYIV